MRAESCEIPHSLNANAVLYYTVLCFQASVSRRTHRCHPFLREPSILGSIQAIEASSLIPRSSSRSPSLIDPFYLELVQPRVQVLIRRSRLTDSPTLTLDPGCPKGPPTGREPRPSLNAHFCDRHRHQGYPDISYVAYIKAGRGGLYSLFSNGRTVAQKPHDAPILISLELCQDSLRSTSAALPDYFKLRRV